MKRLRRLVLTVSILPLMASADLQVVIIEGLGGEARFAEQFASQVDALADAAAAMTNAERIRVFRSGGFSRDDVIGYFSTLEDRLRPADRLAIFLVGHGSYDEHEYKFNIAGPDLTDTDILGILDGAAGTSVLLVNTSSSSGATLDKFKGDNRTLILATRSGVERHATRFGGYFAAALSEPGADLDKNRVITAEEAFRFAERQVIDYFERNGQLATEHPRIEGGEAARFSLARLGEIRPASDDPELTRLVARRDALNGEVEDLRLARDSMTPDAYQSQLLDKMLELAMLEERIERREEELANEN